MANLPHVPDCTVVIWTDPVTGAYDSRVYVGRPSRRPIVQRLAKRGVIGDVEFIYHSKGRETRRVAGI